jgi:thymidine kinase
MAKLYFHYSSMNAGKSTALLQAAHNYQERGMEVYLLTAAIDTRTGQSGEISTRIGLKKPAETFNETTDVLQKVKQDIQASNVACIFIDEAQFLTKDQVWQLTGIVDQLNIPVMAYGLRVDFQGNLFPGSQALLAWANVLREIKTICHCGRNATMVIRKDKHGNAIKQGPQNLVGGNDTYEALCRIHWKSCFEV